MGLAGRDVRPFLAGLPGREVGSMSEGSSGRGVAATAECEPGREGRLGGAGRSAHNVVPVPVDMSRLGDRSDGCCPSCVRRRLRRRGRRGCRRRRRHSGPRSFAVARRSGRSTAAYRRPARGSDGRACCRTTDDLRRATGHRRGRAGNLRRDRLVRCCLTLWGGRRHDQARVGRRSRTETGALSDRREVHRSGVEKQDQRARAEQKRDQWHPPSSGCPECPSWAAFVGRHRPAFPFRGSFPDLAGQIQETRSDGKPHPAPTLAVSGGIIRA
jgi:hypothetical protein